MEINSISLLFVYGMKFYDKIIKCSILVFIEKNGQ